MRPISKLMLLLIALLFTHIRCVAADTCSEECRFSSGTIQCKKGKAGCRCSAVGTFDGSCGSPRGMQFSFNATSAQLNDFERVIENLKTNHELVLVVDGMRDILQAAKTKNVTAYVSSTQKVKAAVGELSQDNRDVLQEQIALPHSSGACIFPETDFIGGYCSDSTCAFVCATAPENISRFWELEKSSALVHVRLNSSTNWSQPSLTAGDCKQLLASAFRMPLVWDRIATEKNALTILSKSDPELAMQLFVKVENPIPIAEVGFPEDVRAYAATEIFTNYWNAVGVEGLRNIVLMARHIGNSGEYPYRAMGYVMNEAFKIGDESRLSIVNKIFDEAITYYRRGSPFQNRNEEFLSLLKSTEHIAPTANYLQALHLLVNNLSRDEIPNVHFIAEIGTSEEFVRFTDMNSALLFRVFPLVAEMDAEWAKSLMLQHPELNKARSKIMYIAAGILYGYAEPSQLARLQNEILEASLANNISRAQTNNTLEVLRMARRLITLKSLASDDANAADRNAAATIKVRAQDEGSGMPHINERDDR
jgi:hypothetical protein